MAESMSLLQSFLVYKLHIHSANTILASEKSLQAHQVPTEELIRQSLIP